jgi:hypothetical protein
MLRLFHQAPKPFKPTVTHPLWGTLHTAAQEFEGSSDSYEDRDVEIVPVLKHPTLLFGKA